MLTRKETKWVAFWLRRYAENLDCAGCNDMFDEELTAAGFTEEEKRRFTEDLKRWEGMAGDNRAFRYLSDTEVVRFLADKIEGGA